jgi:hypothetical protein
VHRRAFARTGRGWSSGRELGWRVNSAERGAALSRTQKSFGRDKSGQAAIGLSDSVRRMTSMRSTISFLLRDEPDLDLAVELVRADGSLRASWALSSQLITRPACCQLASLVVTHDHVTGARFASRACCHGAQFCSHSSSMPKRTRQSGQSLPWHAGFAEALNVGPTARGSSGPAAGRRGSSEDDLPLQLHRAPDRGAERGLNSTPDERRPAVE